MNELDVFRWRPGSLDDESLLETMEWLAVDPEHRRVMYSYDESSGVVSGYVFTERDLDE